ncbi:aspartate ammonia-lyase [Kibdelosporangium aridum]|uniref:Aspartate ammonia-lyase n=1 Tax=Kibdelosporangium aridum TaxID=2030 RepID=A0A428YR72_KIBAR|nr:lyase family protein [Kibdelosporangium aridum]RSM71594.1 aspartate ammonia-lyase [Kibdelosporangium aridum]
MTTRVEHDSLGPVTLPAEAYYGVQTERARGNFAVSGQTLGGQTALLHAIAQVKKAAALANMDIGVLRQPVARAIGQAADEIVDGTLGPDQFPVDVLSAGGGVSPNMNVNEVIANRANELLSGKRGYEFVHPNNHVNAGQSTSDAMATAVNVALHRDILRLRDAVEHLTVVLEDKVTQHRDTVKLSRTCLQDAVPVTFGQAFGAYLAVARRGVLRLTAAAEACLDVPMGGTVVGTGLGVGAGYVDAIYPRLRETTGLPLRRHPDFFDAFQNGDVFQYISTIFKALACGLIKIAKDLRLLASGNRAGLGEIRLPAVQAGSSFMPGKVNPVMAELVVQVGLQVCGNDTVVTMAVEGAELDFNAWTAVIVKNLFESIRLLTATMPLFADKCLRGMDIDTDHNRRTAERSLGLSTVVGGVYGYDAGARAAHHARDHDTTIKDAVIQLGIAPPATAERLLDPVVLTDATRSATLLDDMVADQQARTAALVRGLSPAARAAIYEATSAVARADNEINHAEQHALDVVAEALHLDTVPDGLPDAAKLTIGERALTYGCAAWLAGADSVTDDAEATLLNALREALALDRDTAAAMQAKVDTLRAQRRRYLPRSEHLPWWEEFGDLLARLVQPAELQRA